MGKIGLDNDDNRVQWIIDQLKKINPGKRILDAGAGELRFKPYCAHLQYVAQDFAQYDGSGDTGLQMGTWDQTKLDIVCDIVNIPEPDASFDAIMCIEVFEHLPDPISAIKEFSRLLKPGGMVILTAPFASITHFAPYHFYSGFTRYFYEKHLPDHGFQIVDLVENGSYYALLAQELRRLNFISKKYSKTSTSFLGKVGVQLLLKELDELSKKDTGSKELLNYGLQIVAVKK